MHIRALVRVLRRLGPCVRLAQTGLQLMPTPLEALPTLPKNTLKKRAGPAFLTEPLAPSNSRQIPKTRPQETLKLLGKALQPSRVNEVGRLIADAPATLGILRLLTEQVLSEEAANARGAQRAR